MQNTAFQNVFCKEVALFVLFIYFIIKLFKYSQFWPKFYHYAGVSEARHSDEAVQEGYAAADVLPGEWNRHVSF